MRPGTCSRTAPDHIGAVPAAQGVTVKVAMLLKPPSEAKTVTVVLAVTGVVGMENVTVLDPDAMVTLPGTGATVGSELASVATAPLPGGDALKVTVPVTIAPPLTLAGARLTLESPTTGCSLPQPDSSTATATVSRTVPPTVDRFKIDLFLLRLAAPRSVTASLARRRTRSTPFPAVFGRLSDLEP